MRVVALLLIVSLGGCLGITDEFYEFDPDEHYRNPGVFEGIYGYGDGSLVLQRGNLSTEGPVVVRLLSDLPAYEGLVPGSDSRVDIVMAIWRPNTTEPVPIIVDAGPYFEQGQSYIHQPGQTTPFNMQNFMGHGYAIVQLAVRGTGTAGGCMDLLGPSEVHDLNQAITWLGEQEWSNGNIAMVGASYDGSTSWEVAGTGNPYLKTIFPAAGLPDIYDLMFHNGSAETRGPIMHNTVYWGFGFSQDFPQRPSVWPAEVPWLPPAGVGGANGRQEYQDRQNLLCPEVVEGSAYGAYAVVNGDRGEATSTYWTERDHRQRVLDNYDGSVFLIHGLQDWNVDPHAAIPFNVALREAGIPVKEWYGQWGHAYPDSTCDPSAPEWVVLPCRIDFAEVMYRWLEYYLKGNTTVELGPEVQVQDNVGFWRNAEAFPPSKPDWVELKLSADGTLVEGGAQAEVVNLPVTSPLAPGEILQFVSEPVKEEMHISGLSQLRLPFDTVQGGHIAAWLFDMDPTGRVRAQTAAAFENPNVPNSTMWGPWGTPVVAHAQMNLRHYAGGEEPQVLVPGERYTAKIEFEPAEIRIPEGNRLALWVFQHHYEDRLDSPTVSPVNVHLGDDAVLRLSTVDVDPATVFPVPGANFLNRTYVSQMYVPMPEIPAGLGALNSYGTIPTLSDLEALHAMLYPVEEAPEDPVLGLL